MYRLKLHLHGAEIKELVLESGRDYTFGRGTDCDIQLEGSSGISRVHFRLFEDNSQWTAQVVSKFGDISHNGQPLQHLPLEAGTVFKLGAYDFHFLEVAREESQPIPHISNTLPARLDDHRITDQQSQNEEHFRAASGSGIPRSNQEAEFEGNDEATRVTADLAQVPFLRMVEPDGHEENIRLEGRRTVAGREEGCNILLNDRKSSRRQFEVTTTPQGYFIRDLGSSNGTLLNGTPLAHDELKPIRSGDVIQVGRVVLHFEIRDPNFEKKLMVVPQHVRAEHGIVVQNPYEMINFPVPIGPGGAVRMDGGGGLAHLDQFGHASGVDQAAEKKKKARLALLVGVVVLIFVGVFMMGGDPPPKKAVPKANQEFLLLIPQKQQQVKETYILALNLYTQQKLALASDQLKKLHDILPSGYENSRAMAAECEQQAELERQLRTLEEEKRRQEESRRIVEKTLRDCEPISKRTYAMEELVGCLRPALDLDPENPQIREFQGRVERRVEQRRMAETERRDYQTRVARGKALYDKALTLDQAGEFLEAIDAYKKHAESTFPDPGNLRAVSQRQALAITKKVSARVDDSLRAAEAAYSVSNFKEALDHIERAKKMDPKNERAAEINGKYRRELNVKLREIYEESVISEGLGQIDEAKARWKKILDIDHSTGEYHKKAKNKLRAYGAL